MYLHGGDVCDREGILDFSANINFLGMPADVRAAAVRGVEEAEVYPQAFNGKLEGKIAEKYALKPCDIVCGNGAAEIIFAFFGAIKAKRALVAEPTFGEYERALAGAMDKCGIVRHMLTEGNGFELGEDILDKITGDIDVVAICNPNNPTGVVYDKGLLFEILERCKSMGVWLFVDESFIELTMQYKSGSLFDMINNGSYDKLFILRSFTKLYAMAGLRLGFGVCANRGLMERVRGVLQPWNISLPAQYAGLAALEEEEFAERSRAAVAAEREYMRGRLDGIARVYGGAANFLLFYVKNDVLDDNGRGHLYNQCLERGILIRDCSNFYGLGCGWYRAAVRCREDNERLIEVLGELLQKV